MQADAAVTDAQGPLCGLAVLALLVAVAAGWRDHRRRTRVDPDAVGWIDWVLVQVGALIVGAVAAYVAFRG